MTLVKEVPPTVKDGRTHAFFARILKQFTRFRRFNGTPVERARVLMGPDQIHDVNVVRLYLHHPEGFLENEYLKRVPYTEHELRWAARNGFVLTIVSGSMKRIAHLAGKDVMIAKEVISVPHIAGVSPKHPQWRLVSRGSRYVETKTLGLPERELNRRLAVASALYALTVAYLDFATYQRATSDSLHLTATSVGEHTGDYSRKVMVGGSWRASSQSPVNVFTELVDANNRHSAVLVLRPRRIPLS